MSKLRGASRFVGTGLLDQFVIATANASNTLLAGIVLGDFHLGAMVLALGVGYFAMYLNRAFVGDVLVALVSRHEGETRDRLVRNGVASAATAGLITSVLFVAVWSVWPSTEKVDLSQLVWLAPFMIQIMLHDTGRCDYLSQRRPERALAIDLVWLCVQSVVVVSMIVTGTATPGGMLAAWGAGATAGAIVYLVRERRLPWQGNPREWLAETRHLSGWFTAAAIIGQAQVLSVGFLVAHRLSVVEVGRLRFVQAVQLAPVQNLVTAVQGMVVPRLSRYAVSAALPGVEGWAAAAALRRQTLRLAAAFAVLGVLLVAVMWPVVSYALTVTGKFASVAPIALPISLQGAVYLLQVPFTAALRGMHRAKLLFVQYLGFAVVQLSGLVVGADAGGLLGAVWGLFIGSAAGLVGMVALCFYALHATTREGHDRRRRSVVGEVHEHVAGGLGGADPTGVGDETENVGAAAADLYLEEDAQALEG